MEFFEKYVSDTYAGSGNQLYFLSDGTEKTGRLFYRVSVGGRHCYSFLFSNIIDSTYSDGAVSHCNLICDSWKITGARVGLCAHLDSEAWTPDKDGAFPAVRMSDCAGNAGKHGIDVSGMRELTFDGKRGKRVMPGEFFSSDAVALEPAASEYICLEITFCGRMIPYHEESLIPAFAENGGDWVYSKLMPFAAAVACDRKVKARVAFIGDSITQGIGTGINSYTHWNAVLAEKLGSGLAYWNLGIGYGRASDAASDGAWLYKAKQNDIVAVCFGVNDIMQGRSAAQIKNDLDTVVRKLREAGCTVVLQTVPPFDYTGGYTDTWLEVNRHIMTAFSGMSGVTVFDCVPVLGADSEHMHNARYGGHPDETGCLAWAEALYPLMKTLTEDIG